MLTLHDDVDHHRNCNYSQAKKERAPALRVELRPELGQALELGLAAVFEPGLELELGLKLQLGLELGLTVEAKAST
eukprot:scaffold79963_cov19-Tisochrysis_lutea.AAC.2